MNSSTYRLPLLALVLGGAGLLPFLAFGYLAVSLAAPQAEVALHIFVYYAAVILAFLGGVHWGLALRPEAAQVGARLWLGVVPSLIGWVGLAIALIFSMEAGLAVLLLGFLAVFAAETRARRLDLLPPGYFGLRLVLTTIVVAVMTTVLVLRLLGARIIF